MVLQKRKIIIITLVALLFAINIPPTRADWIFVQRTYDASFTVPPLSWHYMYVYRAEGYKVVIDFQVTAGGNQDIDFFICDQENYDLWSSGYTALVYARHDRMVSWNGEFEFPHSDNWYYVFSNVFSVLTTKTIQLTIDLYQWQAIPPASLIGFGIAAIAIVVLIIIVIGVYVIRKSKAPIPPPQPAAPLRRCHVCNASIAGDETFCGNCGTKLK